MTNSQSLCASLPDRAAIFIEGDDRFDFLQGLITQDITLLQSQPLIYSCLLTSNGKFLFDFFVFDDDDKLVIDCESGDRAQALLKALKKFTLRSKVTLALQQDFEVYQVFRHCEECNDEAIHSALDVNRMDCFAGARNDGVYFKDPRHDDAGYRVYPHLSFLRKQESQIVDTDPSFRWDDTVSESDFNIWDEHRIRLCIPDGSRDMIPEKSFLHESDIIAKTAVSYTKGCYMGQELVSRMHHRGLAKKQLQCVELNKIPGGAELRSPCGDIGLALVRV